MEIKGESGRITPGSLILFITFVILDITIEILYWVNIGENLQRGEFKNLHLERKFKYHLEFNHLIGLIKWAVSFF